MGKILIVEDDKKIVKLIEDTLHLGNYHTENSLSKEDALKKIASGQYDLIIINILLPGFDKNTLQDKLKKIGTPIIFLSNKNDVPSIIIRLII